MFQMSRTPFDKLPSDGGYGGIRVSGNHLSLTATGDGTKGADGYANNGDLNIQGSSVSAKVVDLNAARDVNLTSATNTNLETSSNSSSGWAVGANIGVSASGSMGISVFANANKGKGNANGNGVTHTETQINATDTLNIHSGRDANLIGAQAHGNTVNADIGRDLTITSEQDSSNYNSKQTNMSAGVEIPVYGVGSASASFNMSKQKIDSNYNSVNEQSGIYAGDGGFNVKVNGHTQLNGGAMVSTAPADKNTLDTGSLSVTSIDNHAQYTANNSGIGISTGNLTDIAKGALMAQIPQALNGGEDASSITQSAISPANVIIGGKAATAEQLKDVATTANANSLATIFDVQAVQDQMELASTVGDVGALATNVVSTAMQREAYVALDHAMKNAEDNTVIDVSQLTPEQKSIYDQLDVANKPENKVAFLLATQTDANSIQSALEKYPALAQEYAKADTDIGRQAIIDDMASLGLLGDLAKAQQQYKDTQNLYGPGSDFNRFAQALTGVVSALTLSNNGQALANLSQPYLASAIGTYFDGIERQPNGSLDNSQASTRLLSHAVAGALIAYLSGNDAASGATGAAVGEGVAILVNKELYGNKPMDQMTPQEKEDMRAIATLASGLATALQGGSFEDVMTGAAAGYNSSMNNKGNSSPVTYVRNALAKALDEADPDEVLRLEKEYSGVVPAAYFSAAHDQAEHNANAIKLFKSWGSTNCAGMSQDVCLTNYKNWQGDNFMTLVSLIPPARILKMLGASAKVIRAYEIANGAGRITTGNISNSQPSRVPGTSSNKYSNKNAAEVAENFGYQQKKVDGKTIFFNKKGDPPYLVKSTTGHTDEMFKGFDNLAAALKGAAKNSSKSIERTGTYDANLNRIGK